MFKLSLLILTALVGYSYCQSDALLNCICRVESNCNPNIGCKFDVYSDSCGMYQIKEAYWIDCGRPGGAWRKLYIVLKTNKLLILFFT